VDGEIKIHNSNFVGNKAYTNNGLGGRGGAISFIFTDTLKYIPS
jgi:hypothetical protein